MKQRSHFRIAALMLLCLGGCALFKKSETSNATGGFLKIPWGGDTETEDLTTAVLPMARLEATLVNRPAGDLLIRRSAWQELDESGVMAPEQRQQVNQAGFRVGVAGSSIPWALQSLAQESIGTRDDTAGRFVSSVSEPGGTVAPLGPVFTVIQGGTSIVELQTGLNPEQLPIDEIPELESFRQTSNVRCVFEITAEELNEDWVLLTILPQIHSGIATTRFSVNGSADQLPVRQNVLPLYDRKFQIKLHRGEMAVVGRVPGDDWNLGRLFFQPVVESSRSREGLLMIRLVGVDQVRGQREPNTAYSKYF